MIRLQHSFLRADCYTLKRILNDNEEQKKTKYLFFAICLSISFISSSAAAAIQYGHHMGLAEFVFLRGESDAASSHSNTRLPSLFFFPFDCRYLLKGVFFFFFAIYIHISTYYPSITLVRITDLATGHARTKNGEMGMVLLSLPLAENIDRET
ncbi:hypothetical protein V8C37DRAFT_88348 [Trichoderma ceciliae]